MKPSTSWDSIKAEDLWGKGSLAGKHSQPEAFLLVRGSFDRMDYDTKVSHIGRNWYNE